ncbi:MAG: bifunctional [glutamate--ammonia ligase]-adenylyl-L-tyrosine phosphorylase/[glutamate--ammonia-ligase] adenylyltransferase [Pseudomonadota bacterium]|nr:bifunctional [glutamate--ammonia ligase]-adenylyl-L-tyrosine phosphorylase/[glutamate--ammonia-ligase] adenylyltransferase [Pseudomonadota bacterium]
MTPAPDQTPPAHDVSISRAATFSRWLSGRLNSRPELADWLRETLSLSFTRGEMLDFLATGIAHEDDLKRQLRRLRERVFARVMTRDLNALADLSEVTRTLTELAEVSLRCALDFHHRDLAAIHGEPLDSAGRPQQLIVVGMGKLGGGELNASSDIDLIFVFPEDGETNGETNGGVGNTRKIDNFEFFTRLGKRLINAIGDNTGDGYVFRVDMRLRPYGDSGPLVSSFAMLEEYFYTQAREWERYAWIKGRALTGNSDRIEELEKLRRPFVFRKYLDFGAFGSMRELHAQIRREVARQDKADNIKLGPGGIREIEFIAQVFQLIRGGQQASLQMRPTRTLLHQLAAYGLMPEAQTTELEAAYVFLRNLEHRLQYLDDAQTQMLPTGDEDRQRVAAAMGFADWSALLARLDPMRRKVSGQFEQVFGAPDQSSHPLVGLCDAPEEEAIARLARVGYSDPAAALNQLQALRQGSRYNSLPASNKAMLDGLLPPLIEVAASFPNAADTLTRILDLLAAIARRGPYLALLKEYPQTLHQVARLVSSSPWAAQYLTQQPHLLDELLDSRQLMAPPDWPQARQALRQRLQTHAGDVERQMDELRHFKQSETFRLLAQDLSGMWTLEKLSDHLSDLADLLVGATVDLVWASLAGKHRPAPTPPAFAVIAYGKLGGKELGYASDLDIVFLYDDPHPDAQEVYAKLGKRLNTWMGTLTSAGILYETDLRLRPDGAAGLLVSSVEAFEDYQLHHAWTWEHQALTRARFCCGDPAVGEQFGAIRDNVLQQARDADKLRADVSEMRRKMHAGHPNPSGLFDIKHDAGGLVDVEFAVQYLVLAHAARHPEMTANIGNIGLLKRAGELGLLPLEIALAAANAYRELRRRQHAIKLQGGDHARAEHGGLGQEIQAVKALWGDVFGAD